jgi:hypothetical protein
VGPRWPESDHDLDFMLKPEDADEGLAALVEAGLRPERPPEAWLYKAWDSNGVMVDLIFEPVGLPITDEVFQRSDRIEVEAVAMQVIALEDLFATKLLALDEQGLDYKSLPQMTRPIREQVDWLRCVRAVTNRPTRPPSSRSSRSLESSSLLGGGRRRSTAWPRRGARWGSPLRQLRPPGARGA